MAWSTLGGSIHLCTLTKGEQDGVIVPYAVLGANISAAEEALCIEPLISRSVEARELGFREIRRCSEDGKCVLDSRVLILRFEDKFNFWGRCR